MGIRINKVIGWGLVSRELKPNLLGDKVLMNEHLERLTLFDFALALPQAIDPFPERLAELIRLEYQDALNESEVHWLGSRLEKFSRKRHPYAKPFLVKNECGLVLQGELEREHSRKDSLLDFYDAPSIEEDSVLYLCPTPAVQPNTRVVDTNYREHRSAGGMQPSGSVMIRLDRTDWEFCGDYNIHAMRGCSQNIYEHTPEQIKEYRELWRPRLPYWAICMIWYLEHRGFFSAEFLMDNLRPMIYTFWR